MYKDGQHHMLLLVGRCQFPHAHLMPITNMRPMVWHNPGCPFPRQYHAAVTRPLQLLPLQHVHAIAQCLIRALMQDGVRCRLAKTADHPPQSCQLLCLTFTCSPHAGVKSSGLRRNCLSLHSTCQCCMQHSDRGFTSQQEGLCQDGEQHCSQQHLSIPRVHAHSFGLAHGGPLAKAL